MAMKTVITIGRLYGSGGREVGTKLADRLGIPFYDKELIKISAEHSGLSEDIIHEMDEKKKNSIFYTLPSVAYLYGSNMPFHDLPLNDKVFIAQADVIKKLANAGSCVIIGRCADYVLRDNPNAANIFIHSNPETRKERIKSLYGVSWEDAQKMIAKVDKERGNYYTYYTDQKWGKSQNYHMALDSGVLGVDGCVDLICEYVRIREKK